MIGIPGVRSTVHPGFAQDWVEAVLSRLRKGGKVGLQLAQVTFLLLYGDISALKQGAPAPLLGPFLSPGPSAGFPTT